MKTEKNKRGKVPQIIIDPSLDQYRNKNLFPEKLAKANEMLRTTKLPEIKEDRK